LTQKRIVGKLIKDNKVIADDKFKTPSAPGFFVIRPDKKELEVVKEEDQKWFRSNIGSILYLVKLSRPDLANSVRELSKVMDGAAPDHIKELKRLIQFIGGTESKGLKMAISPEKEWIVEAYSDSDFAGDKDERKSVTGFIILVAGVPISWKSKSQPNVTLSSTEAEYVALCETVREVKFVTQLLETLKIDYQKPVKVNVDNIGAVFLSKNRNSSERTKHIDIKYHYIREQMDKGLIDVVFVRSEENLADLFTKNLCGESYNYHAGKLLKDV